MITSKAILLPQDNIDTDQIIPARFLKLNNRDGFGKYLFRDVRMDQSDQPKDHVLNHYQGEKVLLAGRNFGCGSSREHAAWALKDFGFEAVISSFFSDIFRNNALNNGLLPVQLEEKVVEDLKQYLQGHPEAELCIDLHEQTVTVKEVGLKANFNIDPFRKYCLLRGLDPINYLISIREKISAFEEQYNSVSV